ncbi:MAG: sigma factor-like helix-turn-helix DNA-binding protein [Vicinamibacterales bacterium]
MADRQRPEAGARPRAQAVTAADVEARVLLSQLLDQLTSLERRIFRLKAAGFSTREIALRVSRAPTTVDSVHSRSMVRLRALWTARPGVPAPRLGTDRGRQ